MNTAPVRCRWCLGDAAMQTYHDREWGEPLWADDRLFEALMLEVMQCGLSWRLIMQRRTVLQRCFAAFQPEKVAAMDAADVQRILDTPGMIRSPRKVAAVIHNAQCFCAIQQEYGSFAAWLWQLCGGQPLRYAGREAGAFPASNALSAQVGEALRRRGMKYLGPVTVYSFLQACGMINDHSADCFRFAELCRQAPPRTGVTDDWTGCESAKTALHTP